MPVVDLPDDLCASAARTAGDSERTADEVINAWARLGMHFEQQMNFDSAAIADVLDGIAHYDNLNDAEQSVVRVLWEVPMQERLASLNLKAEFEAEGRSYSELDDEGNVVVRHPSAGRADETRQ